MKTFIQLSLIAIIPVCASIFLHFILKIPKHSRSNYWIKQILIGIVFGGISVLGTEFGVPLNGATMNVRDAAPLCAALIFGAPAGIIAGLIGGIERWFAVYWGAGMYTRLACTISTILVGILGAIMKKYLFNNKIPKWTYSIGIGVIGEVIHMLMVFLTHMDDTNAAFEVVRVCTAPMIIINSIAVGLAVLIIGLLDRENNYEKKGTQSTISVQIQKGLLVLMIAIFVLTSQFIYKLLEQMTINDAVTMLSEGMRDIKSDIDNESDENILEITKNIKSYLSDKNITDEYLVELAEQFGVTEINIVDKNGYIVHSTNRDFIGYDMSSSPQSGAFLVLNLNQDEFAQSYQPIGFDESISRKYAGIALDNGGFIQVGYDAEEFQNDIAHEVVDSATYRHIGEAGGLMVADQTGTIVSSSNNRNGFDIQYILGSYGSECEENELYEGEMSNEKYYFMITRPEGYTIIAYISETEVNFPRDISLYLCIFILVVVFACLFILISILIDHLVVRNFRKVNDSLSEITSGKLDTVIDLKTNREFKDLSEGINETVNAMKQWIDEANRRIDNELAYAKEIQFSSLPTVFPAFPERSEFDIYASMHPAKEVGGDFYDFYMINGNTLAFLVADVSGKGIAAALFMMKAKSIIKNYAENDIAVADILTNANYNLCEGNEAGMFVTCFIAFLNLETGELKYANAGHNRPLIRKKNGSFEYLKAPSGFVLGGMEGIAYKERSLQLEPGDEIFLYTDGVTEATNANKELYGDDRLQNMLNSIEGTDSETLCHKVKENVDEFYKGCIQFDDITMLSVKYKKYMD